MALSVSLMSQRWFSTENQKEYGRERGGILEHFEGLSRLLNGCQDSINLLNGMVGCDGDAEATCVFGNRWWSNGGGCRSRVVVVACSSQQPVEDH